MEDFTIDIKSTEGIELEKLVQTCSACPSQWDAWDKDGTYYYIRFRHGHLTVNAGDVFGEPLFDGTSDGSLDGFMTEAQMLEITGFIFDGVSTEQWY